MLLKLWMKFLAKRNKPNYMNKILIIPKQIVCADQENRILNRHTIEITDNIITNIKPVDENEIKFFDGEIVKAENLTVIPGFIQTHVHLCQTLFRGMADDLELLDWLQQKIFPLENAHDKESLKIATRLGINELMRSGTTTILDMGTLRFQESIFEELQSSGIRAIAGKCMMDVNELLPSFKESTKDELKYTYELAKEFHQTDGRIKYGFAPRFVLSCSKELMIGTKEMMNEFEGSLFHTHASENKNECAEVRKLHKKENIEYLHSLNLLDKNTVLAHCIHVNDEEIKILKNTKTNVSHCPSSNLKLGSGIAQIPKYIKEKIPVSLGADGAPCNNNLSAFTEMRLASLIQKPIHGAAVMDAQTIFRLATIEGAKALHLDNETGSIEPGKKADLVMLNLETPYQSLHENDNEIYSNIVYSSSKENVINVLVDGKWTVKDGHSVEYDDSALFYIGKAKLNELINRL